MLDRGLLRNDPEKVIRAAENKGEPCPIERWQELDSRRRELLGEAEELRHSRNLLSKTVSQLKKEGRDAGEEILKSRTVGREIGTLQKELDSVNAEMGEVELRFPNIPDADVPVGADESSNVVVRSAGERRSFDFPPRPHWDILGPMLDTDASGRITGSNFLLLRDWGAWLQRNLIAWMMDHNSSSGMEEIWMPFVAGRDSMTVTGQIPKLEDDMFHVDRDDLFLVPTGEVPLTNIYRDRIFTEKELPVSVFGYSPCFRREAGSYGKDTRGLNRVHQFEKVEMVRMVKPEDSSEALEEMVSHVEHMLELLGLAYRVSLLATGDLSFAAAKCFDLEVWSSGQDKWLEVSSVSNFRDFQARRGSIRYRPSGGGKPQLVHTLNGSCLALPRIIAALVENGQTREGRVALPDILAERTGISVLG